MSQLDDQGITDELLAQQMSSISRWRRPAPLFTIQHYEEFANGPPCPQRTLAYLQLMDIYSNKREAEYYGVDMDMSKYAYWMREYKAYIRAPAVSHFNDPEIKALDQDDEHVSTGEQRASEFHAYATAIESYAQVRPECDPGIFQGTQGRGTHSAGQTDTPIGHGE